MLREEGEPNVHAERKILSTIRKEDCQEPDSTIKGRGSKDRGSSWAFVLCDASASVGRVDNHRQIVKLAKEPMK